MTDFHPLRRILVLLLSLLWATMGSATALAKRGDFDLCSFAAEGTPIQGPSPQIHTGAQGKHIPDHNNFQPGKSPLTSDPSELGRQAGTGQQVGKVEVGLPGSKERGDFGSQIG